MKPVLFIVGPTGIGKTHLSVKLAEKLDVEIVSADSRQIFRKLDIGTAKPPPEILNSIPHHMINFLRPTWLNIPALKYSSGRKKFII